MQRQTASHLFTMRKLRDNMAQTFVSHGKEVLHKLVRQTPHPLVSATRHNSWSCVIIALCVGFAQVRRADRYASAVLCVHFGFDL